jgi:excisionase family DNA binding protein
MSHLDDLPDLLTVKELQEFLRLGRNRTYALLKSRAIPSIRLGQKFLVPRQGVREFLARSGEPVATGTPVKGHA